VTVAPIIDEFIASPTARRHILDKHGLDLEDAIDAAWSTSRHHRTYAGSSQDRRYIIAGKAADGRRIWVTYDDLGDGTGRVVTAREASGRQDIARHKRLRGD
jgi:YD repeat-containing protein